MKSRIRKSLQSHIYLQIAIGRAGLLHRMLQKLSRNVPTEDPETMRCIDWIQCRKPEKVQIKSCDHLTLTGYYLKHPDAERIVLMFHGWRGGWARDCAPLARALFEKNCSVLMVCQRAQEESEGRYIGFGVLERYDCLEWVKDMNSHSEGLPLYLFGVSMGAATVLMAAGENMPDCVRGIIADCGFTSAYEMARRFAEHYMHLKKEEVQSAVDEVNALCRKKAGYDFREYTTLDAMPGCRTPIFFAHGTADDFVPYEMSLENFNACPAKKTFFSAEGAGHAQSFLKAPEAYLEALTEFFGW